MNIYMKLFTDLVNVDVAMEEEDKALIFLNFLPEREDETFVLTLINGKQTFRYSDVSSALVNYEVRRKDNKSSSKSTAAEAITVREMSSNHRKDKESLKSPKLKFVKI